MNSIAANRFIVGLSLLAVSAMSVGCTSWQGGLVTNFPVDYTRYAPIEITEFDPPEGATSVGSHTTCVTVSEKFPVNLAFERVREVIVAKAQERQADGIAGFEIDRDLNCNQYGCAVSLVCASGELWRSNDPNAIAERQAQQKANEEAAAKWMQSYLAEGWNEAGEWKVTKVMKPSDAKKWFKEIPGESVRIGQLEYKNHDGYRYTLPSVEDAKVWIVSIEKM